MPAATYGSGRPRVAPARVLSHSLAGYLCGTHSGVLRHRRGERLRVAELTAAFSGVTSLERSEVPVVLGGRRWDPEPPARLLRDELSAALDDPAIRELVLFGSQARGGTTAFSDVDAILVIEDDVAQEPALLRRLRARVLAAQRAVLRYQPMQHHGFEVLTPALLQAAGTATELPVEAVDDSTRSLKGTPVEARFDSGGGEPAARTLGALADTVGALVAWPRHPWRLHRVVSMLELAPALYVQALGRPVAKWRSFELASGDFGAAWGPYDVLREVRERWPRRRHPALNAAARLTRNPWPAVAAWARVPARSPGEAAELLSPELLDSLKTLVGEMARRAWR